MFSRRAFLESAAAIGAGSALFPGILYAKAEEADEITLEIIQAAEKLAGLTLTPEEREQMLSNIQAAVESQAALREIPLENADVPALVFDPTIGGRPAPVIPSRIPVSWQPGEVARPSSDEDLAFMTVPELSALLRSRQVRAEELTRLYLARLKKYDGVLECVVTLTEERALRQARAADIELDAGHWRGPLHGIPWGAKDIIAVKGYPTTWGAMPFKDQTFDEDAEVVRRLDAAGAVLVAKLSTGALANDNVWFGGETKTPWNIEASSGGSSAGPGAAVAAGLVGFAIGSETSGSIVYPSKENGVTGFRPTFGRVSRRGAMTLCWTFDKLGPMCRSAACCALVFDAVHGNDSGDPSTLTTPFAWPSTRKPQHLRVGHLEMNRESDKAVLDVLEEAGVQLRPIELPEFDAGPLFSMLMAEAAAAFDELTRSGQDDVMVRQDDRAWPNEFRAAQFIPAVTYINASRARTLLMRKMKALFDKVDVIVGPTWGGNGFTNMTGHPSVSMPNGFELLEDAPSSARRKPESFTILGGLYQDEVVLTMAQLYQSQTSFHRQRPPIS